MPASLDESPCDAGSSPRFFRTDLTDSDIENESYSAFPPSKKNAAAWACGAGHSFVQRRSPGNHDRAARVAGPGAARSRRLRRCACFDGADARAASEPETSVPKPVRSFHERSTSRRSVTVPVRRWHSASPPSVPSCASVLCRSSTTMEELEKCRNHNGGTGLTVGQKRLASSIGDFKSDALLSPAIGRLGGVAQARRFLFLAARPQDHYRAGCHMRVQSELPRHRRFICNDPLSSREVGPPR